MQQFTDVEMILPCKNIFVLITIFKEEEELGKETQ